MSADFLKLWCGQTVSAFGTQLGALGLTALVLLGATPGQMGLLAAAQGAPVLLLGLAAGAWVDRRRRRPVLVAADLGRTLLFALVGGVALAGHLRMAHLYLVALAGGTLGLLFDVSYRSWAPGLVARDELVRANGRLQMSESAAEVGAPAAGGAIVQAFGAPAAILVDAASFLVSAVSVAGIGSQEPGVDRTAHRRMRGDIREGLSAMANDRRLRALAFADATFSFFGGFFAALYGLYAIRELRLPVVVLGALVGAGGAGSLFGAALASKVTLRLGVGGTLVGARFAFGLLSFLIPLAHRPAALAIVLLGMGQLLGDPLWAVYDIVDVSLRQAVAPDALLGRVNAAMHVMTNGLLPMGAIAGGWLAAAAGVRTALVVACCGLVAGCAWLAPVARVRDLPTRT